MNFKDLIKQDKKIFLNLQEFGESHTVDGIEMTVLIDGMEEVEREKIERIHQDGITKESILIYVDSKEFGELPLIDDIITLDEKRYLVKNVINEDGIFSISLEVNRTW